MGIRVLDEEGKTSQTVDSPEAISALGGFIPMFDENGMPQQVENNPENLAAAQSRGWRLETDEEAHKEIVQEKYGDKWGQAALAAGARGLTLGASDWLLTKTGLAAPETLKGLEEANPLASTAGEILPQVGAALLTGGGSAVARGAAGAAKAGAEVALKEGAEVAGKALLKEGAEAAGKSLLAKAAGATPVGQMMKLGRTVEEIVEGTAAGAKFNGLLAKGLASATEGLVYGAGQAVHEAALENNPLWSEQSLGYLTENAGLGMGLGLALPALTGTIGAGLKKGKEAIDRVSKGLFEVGEDGTNALGRQVAHLTGGDAVTISEAVNEMQRLKRAELPTPYMSPTKGRMAVGSEATQRADRLASHLNESERQFDDLVEKFTGDAKHSSVNKLMAESIADGTLTADFAMQKAAALDTISGFAKQIESVAEISQKSGKKLDPLLDKARDVLDDVWHTVNPKDGVAAAADLYIGLDKLKRYAGQLGRNFQKATRNVAGIEEGAALNKAFDIVRDAYETLRVPLENESLWGRAAIAQRDVNKFWTQYLSREKAAVAGRFFEATGEKAGQFGRLEYGAHAGHIENILDNAALLKNQSDIAWLRDHVANQRNLVDAAERLYGFDDAAQGIASRMKSNAREMGSLIEKSIKESDLREAVKAIQKIEGSFASAGSMAAGAAAFALGGPVALAAQQGIRFLIQPTSLVAVRSGFDRMSRLVTEQTRQRISALVEGAAGAGRRGTAPIAGSVAHAVDPVSEHVSRAIAEKDRNKRLDTYWQIRTALENTSGKTLDDMIGHLQEVTPGIVAGTKLAAANIRNYLLSKAPGARMPSTPMDAAKEGKRPVVADSKVREWLRLYQAVSNPLGIIDRARDGTLTTKEVEAVATCWPQTYRQIQTELLDAIAKAPKLTRDAKARAARLLMAPADGSSVKFYQDSLARGSQQEKRNQAGPIPKGLGASVAPAKATLRKET